MPSLALATVGALIAAGPAAAATWTTVASGTGGLISAIATPKADEVVFTTTAGKIFRRTAGGAFAEATLTPATPVAFDDVAMSPEGVIGIAVGEAGRIYRTSDAGIEWSRVTGVTTLGEPCGGGASMAPGDLYSVHFAGGANVIYITGANNTVLKSTDGGMSFAEVNKTPSTCLINSTVGDTYWQSEGIGYLLSNNLGELWRTTDGLSHSAGGTTKQGGGVNGFRGGDRLAVDAEDPTRMWATNPEQGPTFFAYTTNGGVDWSLPNLNDGATTTRFLDVAAGVGTNVLAVGGAGTVYASLDGINFTRVPMPIAGADFIEFESVAFQPGTATAWVGGTNGALLTTADANTLPGPLTTTPPPATTAPGPNPKPPVKCKVPGLKGRSLKIAAKRLKAAHCALGKVMKKKGATARDGKVTKQSQKPGRSLPPGTKIKVTLAP